MFSSTIHCSLLRCTASQRAMAAQRHLLDGVGSRVANPLNGDLPPEAINIYPVACSPSAGSTLPQLLVSQYH
jgi:hypothetical protein|tara:strand:+ start:5346 stop:5561 length:216 start_codon:yes stop_codon:yes gene_type:complete